MTERISALFDGELDPSVADAAVAETKTDPNARAAWDEYALIGDALRGEAVFSGDFVASLMAKLEAEPTVLAPRERASISKSSFVRWDRYLPIAATVAGVALVGWMGLKAELPAAPLAIARPAAATPAVSASDADRAYLLAHHGYAGSQAVPGVGYYIRTVSEQGGAGAQ